MGRPPLRRTVGEGRTARRRPPHQGRVLRKDRERDGPPRLGAAELRPPRTIGRAARRAWPLVLLAVLLAVVTLLILAPFRPVVPTWRAFAEDTADGLVPSLGDFRSEERREGQEGVSQTRPWWKQYLP